jgi:hypothetical protein
MRFLVADGLMNNFFSATLIGLMIFFMLFLLRLLTRREWLATGVFVLLGIVQASFANDPLLSAIESGVGGILIVVLLLRFGLLALVAEIFVENILGVPFTTDLSAWYSGASLSMLFMVLVLAGYTFHMALGGQKVFAGKLLEE